MVNQRKAAVPFVLITVFLDILGIGIVIPVLPALVGTMTTSPDQQAYWYGALMAAYGLMLFCSAPLLGALSDQFGRRPLLLVAIFGLGLNFLLTALSPWLWLLLVARLIGGACGASYSVAGAYLADITAPEDRAKTFGMMGAVFGMGFICGPMFGGLLAQHDLRLPYFAAASLSLLNWLYGFFVLPESNQNRSPFSFAKANPFSALIGLAQIHGIGNLIVVFTLVALPEFILRTTWVLYTTFRFHWGPTENGISLFIVGIGSALGQTVLLRMMLKNFGDVRTLLVGLTSSFFAYILYGLSTQGWMMYGVICANMLGFVVAPALQGLVSKAVDPAKQGLAIGSLNSINSIMGVIAPMFATPILAAVSHYPATDIRVGTTFFLAALLEVTALILALRHFRREPATIAIAPPHAG